MQHFNDFFPEYTDSVRVVSSSSGSWQSQTTKYISCISADKFFINDAIKSATLLAHAVFASVHSSRPSQIKNSAVVDKLRNATTTSFRTDNDSHYKCSAVAEMDDRLATIDMG